MNKLIDFLLTDPYYIDGDIRPPIYTDGSIYPNPGPDAQYSESKQKEGIIREALRNQKLSKIRIEHTDPRMKIIRRVG